MATKAAAPVCLNYLKTLSIGPAREWTHNVPHNRLILNQLGIVPQAQTPSNNVPVVDVLLAQSNNLKYCVFLQESMEKGQEAIKEAVAKEKETHRKAMVSARTTNRLYIM